MRVKFDVVSDVGCVRTNNEDMALAFGQQIRDGEMSLDFEAPAGSRMTAIVADGMGGYDKGEVASEMATQSFNLFLQQLPEGLQEDDVKNEVKRWVEHINREIVIAAQGSGMGCTFTGLFTYGEWAFLINIGDSRTYRLRYDLFKQLTTDHSERNRLDDPSLPSNLIYNALGIQDVFADISSIKLVDGDIYLVCSDGLTDMVDVETIESILNTENHVGARVLVEAAKHAGGEDNVTVLLFSVSHVAE